MLHAIALAHRGFARRIACSPPASHHQVWRQVPMPQRDRVIQPRTQHWRRPPDVLRRSKHNDRSNRASLVVTLPIQHASE